eukprot:948452-Rhodomonas_salina.1
MATLKPQAEAGCRGLTVPITRLSRGFKFESRVTGRGQDQVLSLDHLHSIPTPTLNISSTLRADLPASQSSQPT